MVLELTRGTDGHLDSEGLLQAFARDLLHRSAPARRAPVLDTGPLLVGDELIAALASGEAWEAFSARLAAWRPDELAGLQAIAVRLQMEEARVIEALPAFTTDVETAVAIIVELKAFHMQVYVAIQRQVAQASVAAEPLRRDFVNAVSHELRTPLTSILGFVEFLEEEVAGPLNPSQREFVHQVREAGCRLLRLVEDLLVVARLEAGEFTVATQEADLGVVVAEALAALQPQAASAGVALTLHCPERQQLAQIDPQRIGQVVLNLVANAIGFTRAGGRVAVTVSPEGTGARVTVSDEGPGIDKALQHRLFDKFYQAPASTRPHRGTGLGLAISKALVVAHGGTIGVESAPGEGSRFWFTLP